MKYKSDRKSDKGNIKGNKKLEGLKVDYLSKNQSEKKK